MTDPVDLFSLGLSGFLLALTLIGLGVAAIMPSTERWSRQFFMSLFALNILLVAAALVALFSWERPGMATAEKIAVYFEYLLISVPMPMFTAYLLHTCGESWRNSRIFRVAFAVWVSSFVLLGIAQVTTFMYYVTPDNHVYRGSWHFLLMTPMIMIMLLNLNFVIKRRRQFPRKRYAAFLIYLLPLTVTIFANAFFIVPELPFIGETVSVFSMFGIILYDQIESHLEQQREIANQRASIMVLQMRPHFIYNAMMSIYYLCAKDAKKAQQVTLDFTTYLRKNFTAIVSADTIPFEDELEHTRAYLAVEQVQFEECLLVEYDTPVKDFRLPALTLQPIVENAVKHGMDPEHAPFCISIRTRATDSGSEIIVEDNGSGFDPAGDYEPHTALANVQQRLKMMCCGKLTVRLREGGGTAVTVTIPNLN